MKIFTEEQQEFITNFKNYKVERDHSLEEIIQDQEMDQNEREELIRENYCDYASWVIEFEKMFNILEFGKNYKLVKNGRYKKGNPPFKFINTRVKWAKIKGESTPCLVGVFSYDGGKFEEMVLTGIMNPAEFELIK